MIPTLDGVAIFGAQCRVITGEQPRGADSRPYFGEDGTKTLDGGGRGRVTTIVGTLAGQGPGGLAVNEMAVRSYQDGRAYGFSDSGGLLWTEVQLLHFKPEGRIRQTPDGVFFRDFKAVLLHLSQQ